MKKYFFLLFVLFYLQSCEPTGQDSDKLKFFNNSDYYLYIYLSDVDKDINHARIGSITDPHDSDNVVVIHNKYGWTFKEKDKYTKLYIVKGFMTDNKYYSDKNQILKIIYLKKDSLDAIGWKLEYP
jgi:hypothetical protein